jgi:hypothetical protein
MREIVFAEDGQDVRELRAGVVACADGLGVDATWGNFSEISHEFR